MDIVFDGEKPELDLPYFGRQSRFYSFFEKCITPYLTKYKTYGETNSGSNSNIYRFAKAGYKVIVNDVGEYSNAIANAIFTNNKPIINIKNIYPDWLNKYTQKYEDRAAVFAAIMDLYGYNASPPQTETKKLTNKIQSYKEHILKIKNKGISAYKIYNEDLFRYLDCLYKCGEKVDVMFMDFAWPWRDGSKTQEYETSANELSCVFGGDKKNIQIWDKSNVLENVLLAIKKAKMISRFVFLSNQSSNYPTPEILEVFLLSNNIGYLERHTMLTNATNEDNLLKNEFFREYLYVIKGDIE